MTQRNEQEIHRTKLTEIRNIMNSMKTLAIMQTHKLDRFMTTQSAMTRTIENMVADFVYFNPEVITTIEPTLHIILLIGTERGFCGGFNEQLISQLQPLLTDKNQHSTTLITVGNKLHNLFDKTQHKLITLPGANVVEEVINVVDNLASTLVDTQTTLLAENPDKTQQLISLNVLYHNELHNEVFTEKLLPPFREIKTRRVASSPAILNLSSRDFFLQLTEHYLFNALHRIIYKSLMLENQHRIHHLENATRHLDNKTTELKRKINALRQEEIIEEIEVMLLNASVD